MAHIKTSKGFFEYRRHLLYFGDKKINQKVMLENLHILSFFLDKIGVNWGPAFGTLIGIVRNDNFQPWKPVFDIYILKEDEERFKDVLWSLREEGVKLVRYERRGRYYLERDNEYIKVYILTKVCSDVRHTGSSDFIHEKYLQNTVLWEFKGLKLNVPSKVDEYLAFQYGDDWTIPKQTVFYSNNCLTKYYHWIRTWIFDHLPDTLYYYWLMYRRQKDFSKFKQRCENAKIALPVNVQFANMKPRKYKKVLTVGVYDLLHKGHVELFRRAKGLGDYLIVAAQDSDYVQRYKPESKVLNSTADRTYLIKSIRYVDEVITYTDVDKIIKEVDFDIFVTGPDQCHNGFMKAIEWCEEHGKEHFILGRTDGVSSSELKQKIIAKMSVNNSK